MATRKKARKRAYPIKGLVKVDGRVPVLAAAVDLPPSTTGPQGSLTIALDIPARDCTPNASTGHSRAAAVAKAQAIKAHRETAKLVAFSAIASRQLNPKKFIGYTLKHYFPSQAKTRDDDNADGACKAYRDGIADALGVDDKSLRKLKLSEFDIDKECPRVEITLHQCPPDNWRLWNEAKPKLGAKILVQTAAGDIELWPAVGARALMEGLAVLWQPLPKPRKL